MERDDLGGTVPESVRSQYQHPSLSLAYCRCSVHFTEGVKHTRNGSSLLGAIIFYIRILFNTLQDVL